MFGSDRESHPDVRQCSEDPPECPEGLEYVQEWSGVPPRCLGVFGKPTRMPGRPTRKSQSGRETLTVVWEWSGVPPRF